MARHLRGVFPFNENCYICISMRYLVIIPTYNEVENVEKIIRAVMALEEGFDILVIDDGSPDGTADAVKAPVE